MEQLKFDKDVVSEKVKFIEDNAAIIFFIRGEPCGEKSKVQEALANILLSNKSLEQCPDYVNLLNTINKFDTTGIIFEDKANYALSLLIETANYINRVTKTDMTSLSLRNRLRYYTKRMNKYLTDGSVVIEKEKIIEKVKVKEVKI